MIFDGVLAAAGDDRDFADSGCNGLFDDILDQRFIDQRQHFFRLGFRGRQESRSQASGGKNAF